MSIRLLATIYFWLYTVSVISVILTIGSERKPNTPLDALIIILTNIPLLILLWIVSQGRII